MKTNRAGVLLVIVVGFIVLAVKLKIDRYHGDTLWIQSELMICGIVAFIMLLFWGIVTNVGALRSVNDGGFPITSTICHVVDLICFLVSVVYPTVLTYSWSPKTRKPSIGADDITTVEEALKKPDLMKNYLDFLAMEFSVENILFYDAVHLLNLKYQNLEGSSPGRLRLRQHSISEGLSRSVSVRSLLEGNSAESKRVDSDSPDTMPPTEADFIRDARTIYEEFLVPGALLEVNLPYTSKARIAELLDQGLLAADVLSANPLSAVSPPGSGPLLSGSPSSTPRLESVPDIGTPSPGKR